MPDVFFTRPLESQKGHIFNSSFFDFKGISDLENNTPAASGYLPPKSDGWKRTD